MSATPGCQDSLAILECPSTRASRAAPSASHRIRAPASFPPTRPSSFQRPSSRPRLTAASGTAAIAERGRCKAEGSGIALPSPYTRLSRHIMDSRGVLPEVLESRNRVQWRPGSPLDTDGRARQEKLPSVLPRCFVADRLQVAVV